MRGTAIVAKRQHLLTNILTIPSGRAIAAHFQGITLVSVYAPSGTAQRAERERFFNADLTHLLQDTATHVIIGGDFKCPTSERHHWTIPHQQDPYGDRAWHGTN
jgi:exonuclease III